MKSKRARGGEPAVALAVALDPTKAYGNVNMTRKEYPEMLAKASLEAMRGAVHLGNKLCAARYISTTTSYARRCASAKRSMRGAPLLQR
jgi:hypothetical protein